MTKSAVIDGWFNVALAKCLPKARAVIAFVCPYTLGAPQAPSDFHAVNRGQGGLQVMRVSLGGDGD